MSRKERMALVVLWCVTALGAVGVYLWYQADLAAQADEQAVEGPLHNQVNLLLSQRPPRREEVERLLRETSDEHRWDALDQVATRPLAEDRLVAVAVARRLRDQPRARALLTRLALEDPDAKVKDAARKALAGEPP